MVWYKMPSSVLASRIMRAHDNPSPPPQSPENTLLHPQFAHDALNTSLSPTPDPQEDPFSADEPQDTISARVPITPLQYQDLAASDTMRQSIIPMTEHNAPPNDSQVNSHTHECLDSASIAIRSPSEERTVAEPFLTNEPTSADPVNSVIELSAEDSSSPEEPPSPPLRRSSRPRRSVYNLSPLREVTIVKDNTPLSSSNEPQALTPDLELPLAPLAPTRRQPRQSGHQKLASLSPHSLKLLGEISGETSEDVSSDHPHTTSVAQSDTIIKPVISNFRWPEDTPNTPSRTNVPIRFPSPKRTSRPPSPNKYQLHIPIAGPSTPARRIPISEAIAQGQLSPQKAAQLSISRGTGKSRTPFLKIPPNDTPARRVPILPPQSNNPPKSTLDLSQGKRPLLHERSRSVEPESSAPVRLKPRSGSLEPASKFPQHPLSSGARTAQELPFPIIYEDVSEQSETQQTSTLPSKKTPVQQTTLKQKTSKIPRRTFKPYSRPTSSAAAKEAANRVGQQSSVRVAEPPTSTIKKKRQMQTNISQAASSSNPNLKRKRATVETPSTAKPVVVVVTSLRQASKPSTSSRSQLSPKKNQALLNLRQVKMEKPPSPPAAVSVHSDTPPESKDLLTVMENITLSTSVASHTPVAPLASNTNSDRQLSSPVNGSATTTEGVPVQYDTVSDLSAAFETDSPEPLVVVEEPPGPYSLRRTTRVRKPVTGSNPPSTCRADIPSQPRRRKPPVTRGTGPFSSMTAGDLRQLTNSNTTKNQKYLTAMLETAIIRREGPRPESPGIRAKTVSQKEEKEKEREKNARADRRANRTKRRSGESLQHDGQSSGSLQQIDDDEVWEHLNSSPSVRQHRRGAGEDEDYESPKHYKRFRTNDNADEDKEEAEMDDKKRVKWDQGLFTTVILDEVQPRPRHGFVVATKGCLAPTSKTIKLDDLGNLPTAEFPLEDLVQENVVVKKFVYDTDIPEPPSRPAVVKNTRSKKKSS
ncbi:hypothetical protein E1B28_008792 [Marasmius oreades]|uniref:Uncharacterized protein n=1 Tax=Marasmius oreades TaxID=181124 RepID=A0A9P7RZR1_9AGAR|nr:uncharacterized protein E1B28_008792 [Marasmius oreades]KAG7092437.1 hypothetical protein E1B28_008792 [Marasmius oreades]